jgi:hypothetical protein
VTDICTTLADHADHWTDMVPHLATLSALAADASSVVEMGTRGGVSTWAILDGLPHSGTLVSVDIDPGCRTLLPSRVIDDSRWSLVTGDSLAALLPAAGLVVIDTSHTLAQTRAEIRAADALGARVLALHDWALWPVRRAICEWVGAGGWTLEVEPSQWGLAVLRRLT